MAAATSAGSIDDLERVTRFLLIGHAGNSYLANRPRSASALVIQTELQESVKSLIAGNMSKELCTIILDQSDYTVHSAATCAYLLAACSVFGDANLKRRVLFDLRRICPASKDLFAFVEASERLHKESKKSTGWGRAMRLAVAGWYHYKLPPKLVIACSSGSLAHDGWTHRDVLRLCHFSVKWRSDTTIVAHFLLHGLQKAQEKFTHPKASPILSFLKDFQTLRKTKDELEAAVLVEKHSFPYDSVPTSFKKSTEVIRSVIPHLPLDQLLILLKHFNKLGFLSSESTILPIVLEQLASTDKKVAAAKLHPIAVYVALRKYEDPVTSNRYQTGKRAVAASLPAKTSKAATKRPTVPALQNALNSLMTAAIKNYPATGKRCLIAVDVRQPMEHSRVFGFHQMTAAQAAALIVLQFINVEKNVTVLAFSGKSLVSLTLKADMSLVDVVRQMRETPMGAVNCAQPMLWAKENKQEFDAFIVLTDIQTLVVDMKPSEALHQYRQEMNLPKSRLVICALAAKECETVDDGPGVMYVVGLDHQAPHVIREFVAMSGVIESKTICRTHYEIDFDKLKREMKEGNLP